MSESKSESKSESERTEKGRGVMSFEAMLNQSNKHNPKPTHAKPLQPASILYYLRRNDLSEWSEGFLAEEENLENNRILL